MDMGLPELNGVKIIYGLHQPEIGLNNTPIIATNCYNRTEDRYILLEAGVNNIL